MKEYIDSKQRVVFIIDEDGDSFDSFKFVVNYIENTMKLSDVVVKHNYWDSSNAFFVKENIKVNVNYDNWDGTVLKTDANLSNEEISKVRQWAQEIYDEIHKNENNVP